MNNYKEILCYIKKSLEQNIQVIEYNIEGIKNIPSARKNYIIKIFKNLFINFKTKMFELEKHRNNMYSNAFFKLDKDKLTFIGKEKKVVINKIEELLKSEIFIPNKPSDFALIHDTHSDNKANNTQTSVLVLKEDISQVYNGKINAVMLSLKDTFDKKNKKLIIVENYKIFEIQNLFKYLEQFQVELIDNDKYDLIYGSGNKITSSKNINFINSYEEVIYLGDLDDEGYDIYLSLKNKIKIKSIFLLPKKDVIYKIQKKMSEQKIFNARKTEKVYIKNKDLLNLIEYDKAYEMQQEVFLLD